MDDLDDDYVAKLLKNEATSRLSGYSTHGLNAILPSRAKDSAPKPNTRFLKNIVRNVDSHNAALRARDTAEARLRLHSMQSGTSRNLPEDDSYLDGDSQKLRERRRRSSRRSRSRQRSRSPVSEGRQRHRHRSHSRENRLQHHKHPSTKRHRESHRRDSRRRSHHSRRHDVVRTNEREEARNRDRTQKHPRRRPTHTDLDTEVSRARRHRPSRQSRDNSPSPSNQSNASLSSDPLVDLVGPPPPLVSRARGRGGCGQSSIDEHFRDNYDPAADVQPKPDNNEDEWENAVEDFRDRLKWKQQGAERLRSAGFDEQFVTAWENNALSSEENLKWAKKGATREWDRGKVVDDATGDTKLRIAWAKKT